MRNYITTFKATLAKWHAQGEQGSPPIFNLFDYFQDKAWRKMGIPSDPLELPKPPSVDAQLCRRVLDRNKPGRDHAWAHWHAEESEHWQDWDRFFKAHGFDGAPIRVADSTDEYCGAHAGARGWRFPSPIPNAAAELVGWNEASDEIRNAFLQLKKLYNEDALCALAEEEYVWTLWQSMDEFNRADALALWPAHHVEFRKTYSEWVIKKIGGDKPAFPRPSEYLLGIEQGYFQHLKKEKALA